MDLGLASLARRLERVLRQRGGNEVANVVLRAGKGPSWKSIVDRLARKSGVPVSTSVEATEFALLETWVRRSWDTLEPSQQQAAWKELDLVPPTPNSGDTAITQAKKGRLPTGYALSVAGKYAGPAAIVALTPVGLAGCATMLYLARPKDHIVLPALLEVARLRQLSRHRITVGVVGSPSSGKDAAIKAVFGIDSGNINPVAGSTTEVAIHRLPGATALYVVNTPGMGDVIETVTEEARQVLDLVDVYVYVLNSQGGVQQRELNDYQACVRRGRPVLVVVNKIDTLREEDRTRYLDDARGKLRASDSDFMAAAFDPLPQLAESPIGVDAVRAWLSAALIGLGKSEDEVEHALAKQPPTESDSTGG